MRQAVQGELAFIILLAERIRTHIPRDPLERPQENNPPNLLSGRQTAEMEKI